MDIRALSQLALKLVGLYLLIRASTGFLQMVALSIGFSAEEARSLKALLIPAVFQTGVGAFLLWKSGKIINILLIPGERMQALHIPGCFWAGARLICLYFILDSIYTIVYWFSQTQLFYIGTHPGILTPSDKASLLATTVQCTAAAAVWFYSMRKIGAE